MRKLISEDLQEIQAITNVIELGRQRVEIFVTEFNGLLPGDVITTEQLIEAIDQPEDYFKRQLTSRIPKTEFGIPVDVEQRLKTFAFPDFKVYKALGRNIKNAIRETVVPLYIFEIDGNNVSVSNENKQMILDRARIYAEDKTDLEFIEHHRAFVNAFKAFKKFHGKHYSNSFLIFDIQNYDIHTFIQNDEVNLRLFTNSKNFKK